MLMLYWFPVDDVILFRQYRETPPGVEVEVMILSNISKICSINSYHIGLYIYIYIYIYDGF